MRLPLAAQPCALLLTLSLPLLGACAVGPDFKSPPAPDAASYTGDASLPATAATDVAGGNAQNFQAGQDIPGEWWTLFHSERLNQQIAQALKNNPSLEAAQASLKAAQENAAAGAGAFFPSLAGNLGAEREKFSSSAYGLPGGSSIFNVTSASLNVSYTLDVFGGIRRQVESLDAMTDYQQDEVAASYLALTSNVTLAAIAEASLRAQIKATQDIIKLESDQLHVLNEQFNLGAVSKADVLEQEAELDATKATLPPLEKQLAQVRDQQAALLGVLPDRQDSGQFLLTDLQLPADLPISVPSKLVANRPDIREAEATLHVTSANVGVALANQLPQFTISGAIGNEAGGFAQNFTPGTGVWSIAGNVLTPIFEGGMLEHKERSAEATYDQSAALYRATVLAAFQNVSDALRALQSDADTVNAEAAAEKAAADSLSLAQDQFKLGAITYSDLLNAQKSYQQTHIGVIQAIATRYSDTVALFEALGGGWWNHPISPPADAPEFHHQRTFLQDLLD